MKRPLGITILCFALGWLAIAGVGNASLILTGKFSAMPIYLGAFAALYGITATLACVGLWRMTIWGLRSLQVWMLVCLAMLVAMIPTFGDLALGGVPGILLFGFVTSGLFWLLNRYATSHVRSVA